MNPEREIFAPGFVVIENGSITAVGPGSAPNVPGARVIQATGSVVIPGLVNAHNHLDQSLYRGCLDELPDSRTKLLGLARGLTRERATIAARASLLEQAQYGITTTHESHWTHYHIDSTDGICEAIQESGMRAVVARSMNDNEHTPEDFRERIEDVIADLDRLANAFDSKQITIIPEPTTILRCTPDAVIAMRDWAVARGKLWHIHLAQGREELADALATVNMGSVQYAEKLGVLGPEMLAAHCSGLLDEEVELLGRYGVKIAHCPAPVIRGGGTVPPIWELERLGSTVAIATDGSGTNNGQNLWEAMKLAVYMQRVRFGQRHLGGAEQALEGATIKAAKALGLEAEIGSLEIGKRGDLATFRLDQLSLAPAHALINNLVYSSTVNLADTVIAGGDVLIQGGRSTRFDERTVAAELSEVQQHVIHEAGFEGELRMALTWPVITS